MQRKKSIKMDNLLLLKKDEEIIKLSKQLGFTKTLFEAEELVLIEGKSRKEILRAIRLLHTLSSSSGKKTKASKKNRKLTLFRAESEELLRFALEKTAVDIVLGMEQLHPKDNVHFVRGGLDQVLCKIASEKGKIIAFSFSDILNAKNRPQLLARMLFNIKLCKKYKVKMLFSNFSREKTEMRSAKDLRAFWEMLGGGKMSGLVQ